MFASLKLAFLVDSIIECKLYHSDTLVQIMKGIFITFKIARRLCGKVLNHNQTKRNFSKFKLEMSIMQF